MIIGMKDGVVGSNDSRLVQSSPLINNRICQSEDAIVADYSLTLVIC